MERLVERFKIGIVGPISSCRKIEGVIREEHPEFEILIYPSEKIEAAHEVLQEAEYTCDGIIFTGIGVYCSIKEKYKITRPHIHISYGYETILKVLWDLREKFPTTMEFSIDTVGESEVSYLLKEFEMENYVAHILPYSKDLQEEDYLNFHKKLVKERGKVIAISGFDWVYNQLRNETVECVRLYAIRRGIQAQFEELLHMVRLRDEQDSSICVQIFQIMTGNDEGSSPYRALEIGADFKATLVEYLKCIKGSIFSLGFDKYIVFSTLGAVKIPENLLKLKGALKFLERKNIRIAVGTGIGKSAYESEVNANKALSLAKQEKRSSIYEVTPKEVRGPLLEEREISFESIIGKGAASQHENISEKAKVALLTVERIKNMLNREKKDSATSEEIALHLDTTVRNANRIIKKFLDSGLCEINDTISTSRAGRPKKVVRFLF